MRRLSALYLFASALGLGGVALGGSTDSPRPVPLTRPEMKQLIEDVKVRTPRIPLPEPSSGEATEESYESRLRETYLPWAGSQRRSPSGTSGSRGSSRTREQDPRMTLDYAFKTELFWIVSRVNNCHYCLGHQESKLLGAGLSENDIAALDGDWSGHTPAERAAFQYARKLSFQPYAITDADIEALKAHYTDLQVLEMTVSIGRNNLMNRWKEAVAVPQRKDEGGYGRSDDPSLPRGSYLTATAPEFQKVVTKVAPVILDPATGQPTSATASRRPALESWEEVEAALEACRAREARLPLVDEATARSALGELAPQGAIPQWMLLYANFPSEGASHARTILLAEQNGELSPLLKAQIAWIVARQDGAWYAAGEALKRLREQGRTDSQIAELDGDWGSFAPGEQALFTVARTLAASPVVLTDADVAEAVAVAGPRDVVETIHYTTTRGMFDRVTEAAGLRLEE